MSCDDDAMMGPGVGPGEFNDEPRCSNRPEDVPDPRSDECLACLLDRCCENWLAFECFRESNADCYEELFSGINACTSAARAGEDGAGKDAGSDAGSDAGTDSWYVAAECFDQLVDPYVRDGGVYGFPFSGPRWRGLLACVIGYRPSSAAPDEDVGKNGRNLYPTTGFEESSFFEAACATECIERW